MDSGESFLTEHQSPVAATNSEEVPDRFVCCVCLDLLYKPIVLHCGHISCFWCVHKSMSSRYESHCPICRNPYSCFPRICQTLQFLLLKLYPIAYKKREDQILEFNGHAHEAEAGGEFNYLRSPAHSFACSDSPSTSKEKLSKPAAQVESHYNGTTWTKENSDGDLNQTKPIAVEQKDQVSVVDLLCTACKQWLFCPVVLNCGHVYCQTCINIPADTMLRCQVCQCLHPRHFPEVCLTLDQFLVAKFPKEYALRRDSVQPKQVSSKHERATTCSMEAGNQDFSPIQLPSKDHLPFSVEPSAYTHIGVGCDACGMSPIVGDRYKCKDCIEKAGFDLCGDCYNTRPKLPGRFNQRHTPEHKFKLIKRDFV
ncbi:E3 ubiquitin-protein ligase PRT1-like isoform X2 [Durio zibethinus]|uniref:E3 ubiquitin-protein ligase PRT1-like isoform X2 n=1 Tax=Durio zibethinus TaxID=66656 RepID=A0A6P6B2T2_DURZI|nr:E3 ubiquitin-protein ligase PRT1-like isoform X2 [Durio zibethinus]